MNKNRTPEDQLDLETISRLIDGKPAKDPEADPEPILVRRDKMTIIPETETTVDIDELDRLKTVCSGAFVGCLVVATVILAAFIAFPAFLPEVTTVTYWIGMGAELVAVLFMVCAFWIKNYVIGG